MLPYSPLHNHSDASLDGAGPVQGLVAEAARLKFSHLALTDHGTLGNAVAFWAACEEQGIVPIHGLEAYLLYNNKRHHITLLSLNENGFNNLVHLDTWSHDQGWIGGYPTIDLNGLEACRQDLFVLSGCAASAMYVEEEANALGYVGDLMSAVGKDNVALECMFVGTHNTWDRPIRFAKRTKLPFIVTNDTHYPCKEQHQAHQTVCSARRGFTYDSYHLWLKSQDEILASGRNFTDEGLVKLGLANTRIVTDRVTNWSMKSPPSLPHTPEAEQRLKDALAMTYKQDALVKGEAAKRKARLEYEWKILKGRGFLDYVYILWDIVSWAKSNGIKVGPGRGSGGGSYVLYLLGVTSIDPLEYGLYFERFLNPSRSDYPDVDVDFESDRRQEVMNYARDRWNTLPIATYACYSHKSAIHDIARVLHIPKDLEVKAAEAGQDSDVFREFTSAHPLALATYNTMLGQIRHKGTHAAGVIIANRPVPVERTGGKGELAAAWAEGTNTKDLSKVGIVKYDLLGLTALSQLKLMEELTSESAPSRFDDDNVYDLFCAGDVAGVFQWSGSDGIRELTQRVAPRNFYDLTTCNALYRPGALHAGTAEDYPFYMQNPRLLHPRIDPHLAMTYGVICYQEQVMAVVAEVMGGDLGQADIVRRLMSKAAVGDPKWEAEIAKLKKEFQDSGTKQGFDANLLDLLWAEIYMHSGYSYNLSHASAYTMISYQMAWYKVYHRAAFTVAVLQYDKANAQTYILDAIESGLKISMPHVNQSSERYELHGSTIYLPLNDVAFLGEKAVQEIIEQRKLAPFTSYEDFDKRISKRICNSRARGLMERLGCFKGLAGNPEDAMPKYSELPLTSHYDTQLEILGYVVPTKELYARIKKLQNAPAKKHHTRFAGFISQVKQKKSAHGPYTVFTLSPQGSFWCRNAKASLKVGAFVSGTKSSFGHSQDVKVYRLDRGE